MKWQMESIEFNGRARPINDMVLYYRRYLFLLDPFLLHSSLPLPSSLIRIHGVCVEFGFGDEGKGKRERNMFTVIMILHLNLNSQNPMELGEKNRKKRSLFHWSLKTQCSTKNEGAWYSTYFTLHSQGFVWRIKEFDRNRNKNLVEK